MNQTLDLLKEPMVHDALKAALMVAVVCSYLGVFVVLKRIVFVGAALAEVASLGAALALTPPVLWAFGALIAAAPALEPLDHYRPLVLAMTLMLISVAFFSQQRRSRRLPQEAVIGTVVAAATGLTLLVLSKVQSQDQHALEVLQGSILGVEAQELTELAIACLVIGLVQVLFYKEFVLVSFDPEVARTLGYRSSSWELLWYLSLGTMIAVSIHAAGTVLVFAYLVIPPVTALLLSRRLGLVLTLSVLLAVVATCVGVVLSIAVDVPTSYAIVGCSVALFALCWVGRA
ncbi:MAG TPA: metal ABC transporter permease, partial [Armatimonadota bacterium]|nr:metal ABC transporter permease [Armatimonadota bacterium]